MFNKFYRGVKIKIDIVNEEHIVSNLFENLLATVVVLCEMEILRAPCFSFSHQ